MAKPDYAAFTEIIRNRVSADELAKDFGLNVGRDGRCLCVFCSGERKDTMKLYSGDRGFYCFRCHERGDVISLYQKLTGCGFRQAVEGLNDQYGIGLPLSGKDEQAILRARELSEKRKREREEKIAQERRLFEEYLNAADAVWIMEHNRTETAPETTTEPWKQRFVISLRYLDQMRDYRDRLFDEISGKF